MCAAAVSPTHSAPRSPPPPPQNLTCRLLRTLLAAGADPSATADGGGTALQEASRSGPVQATKLLLEYGADHAHVNDLGHTALTIAEAADRGEIVRLLQSWDGIRVGYEQVEYAKAWEGFCDTPAATLAQSATASRVITDLSLKRHQMTLQRTNNGGRVPVDRTGEPRSAGPRAAHAAAGRYAAAASRRARDELGYRRTATADAGAAGELPPSGQRMRIELTERKRAGTALDAASVSGAPAPAHLTASGGRQHLRATKKKGVTDDIGRDYGGGAAAAGERPPPTADGRARFNPVELLPPENASKDKQERFARPLSLGARSVIVTEPWDV